MLKLFHQQRPEKNLDEHQFGAFFKEDYEKLKTIGEGTYGKIKIATHLNGKKYAIKTTDNVPREGVALQTLREIVIMQDLAHINIMRLDAVYRFTDQPATICMQMDLALYDLTNVLKRPLTHSDIKFYSFQLFQGLDYAHSKQMIHRDLKPANILVFEVPGANNGNVSYLLRIADWGMGRFLSHPARAYSPNVQTLLYRAPEVLFNEPLYHCEIDVFSVGVIIAEMVKGIPMFAKCAKNEIELVRAWQSKIGTIPPGLFKNAPRLADSEPVIVVNDLAYLFKTRTKSKDDKACAEFIKKTLIYDPEKRMRAREAFYDEYVKSAFLDPRVSILYNDHENWDRSFHEKRGNYVGTKDVLVGGRTHLPSPDEELN